MRALDKVTEMGDGVLKQRQHELLSELALIEKKNKSTRIAILRDYITIEKELRTR